MIQDASLIVAALHDAVHQASADYFHWSRGQTLYDYGVEALLQVYVAQRLYAAFGESEGAVVRIERACNDFSAGEPGRFDVSMEARGGAIAIECKRYSSNGNTSSDLGRLRRFAREPGRFGFLVAPCYMKDREGNQYDWPARTQADRAKLDPPEHWHLSEIRTLPDRTHAQGWTHERALVIQV